MATTIRLFCALTILSAMSFGIAYAETADSNMKSLADGIKETLVKNGCKHVAVIEFTNDEGRSTGVGHYLWDELTMYLVGNDSLQLIEPARLRQILGTNELTSDAILDPENAKRLRDYTGLDSIVVGTIHKAGPGIRLTVRVILTGSAAIIQAESLDYPTLQIDDQSAPAPVASGATKGTASEGVGDSGDQDGKPLAVKYYGPLRVALKSVAEVAPGDQPRRLQVLLELTNQGSQSPLVVAINGEGQNRNSPAVEPLRSHVIDDAGGTWNLFPTGLYGIGYVRVGVHGSHGAEAYAPTEIARLLQLRDDLGSGTDDPSDGFYANADSCGEGGCNSTFGPGSGNTSTRKFFAFTGNTFVSGVTTTIGHGQSTTVTMTFVPRAGAADYGPLVSFNIQSEIVLGVMEEGTKRVYSLQNLDFEIASEPVH